MATTPDPAPLTPDVHARSVVAPAIDVVTGELVQARLTSSHKDIRSWLGSLPGQEAVAYEAGPTGFGLARSLTAEGIDTLVAAPSKLQRPRQWWMPWPKAR